jgi:hypothetical protein
MNKKQKTVVFAWCALTTLCGVLACGMVDGPRFHQEIWGPTIAWITASLIASALFWMFSEKNWPAKKREIGFSKPN